MGAHIAISPAWVGSLSAVVMVLLMLMKYPYTQNGLLICEMMESARINLPSNILPARSNDEWHKQGAEVKRPLPDKNDFKTKILL